MRLEIGQIVGDYEVIGILGAGGMGSVYKVRNLISDRVDAMKILLPDLKSSPELAERFLNEIKVLASLSHPNIAALHTALRVDNQLLMIMEFVQGENLDERLQKGVIPVPASLNYISQVLSALEYAHMRGIVHRDIKPANIAVKADHVVKLLDFGIARAGSMRLTRTGMVLGSLYYMSPEQVHGQPADPRSDLYSLGVTLYRMITGRRPIDGETEFAVMRAQVSDIPVSPRHYNPAVPHELADVILKGLLKDPAQRFQTAADFRAALQPFHSSEFPRAASQQHDLPPTVAMSSLRPGDPGTFYSSGSTHIPSSAIFNSAALTALQKNLAQAIGPFAGTLVKKHSKSAASLGDLCRLLSEEITSEPDRRAFLKACKKEFGAGALEDAGLTVATPIPGSTESGAFDPSLLEKSRKDLAAYIGPLAKIIVDRAAKKARNVAELYALIGAEIPSQKDRDKFLSTR